MDEQELAAIEAMAPDLDPWVIDPETVLRLVAEVRRLRAIATAARALGLAYHPETPRPYVSITPDGYPGSTLWAGCPEADRDHAAAQGAIERLRGALGPR